jgi:hypothetical protein
LRPGGAGRWQAPSNQERRNIESLAQALYEADNQGGVAWARRTQTVRDPWLARARRELTAVGADPKAAAANPQGFDNDGTAKS